MITKGTILKCQTKTKDNTFGTVIWEIMEVGLKAPEKHRRDTHNDGVKVVLLAGTGPKATAGMTLIDSEWHIMEDVKAGITMIVPSDQKEKTLKMCQKSTPKGDPLPRHGGSGVVDW